MKLIYTDPKKKRLQMIEIALMVILLPPGLYFGAQSYFEWQQFRVAEASYLEASEMIHAGQYEKGAAKLEEALEIYPELYAAWEELGVTYHLKGEHEKEVKAYERAVEALPENGNLHRELAAAYHEIGEHGKELKMAERAVTLENSDPLFTQKTLDRAQREASGELSTEAVPRVRAQEAGANETPDLPDGHSHGEHEGHTH